MRVKHKFKSMESLLKELDSLIDHYKKEGVYLSHEILSGRSQFVLLVNLL